MRPLVNMKIIEIQDKEGQVSSDFSAHPLAQLKHLASSPITTSGRSPRSSASVLKRTDKARRIARVNPGQADVLGYDSASADTDVITDRYRQDGSVRPDTYIVTKLCWPPKIMISTSRASADKKVINKHYAVRNEAIVADCDSLTDKCVRLDFASLPDRYLFLYFNKWTDKGVVSDHASVQIDRLHHGNILPKFNVYDANRSEFRRCHKDFSYCPFKWNGRARSRIETTVRAWLTPVRGTCPLRTQSLKCSASTRSGSMNLTCGNRMSPLR
jgi:hypothetical protein